MKIKAAAAAVMAILVSLAIGNNLIRAQTLTQPQAQALVNQLQSLQAADDLSTMVQAVETTTPAPASSLPYDGRVGTFYSAQFLSWPPLPGNINQLPVWCLGDNIYLLADENFDYNPTVIAPQMATSKSSGVGMMTMDVSVPPVPGGGGTNSGGISPHGVSAPVNYGTNLWIARFSVATNNLLGIASNTEADISYEIQGISSLTQTNWTSLGFILGSEITNWTSLNTIPVSLTNNYFLRLKSWVDSTGSGIPDWWWLEYFGQVTNVDPNADPMGDGWNNLQKFQNGWNPNVAYPPPTPEGFTANYNPTNGMATFTWQPSPAPVSGYTLQITDYSTGLTNYYYFAAGTNSFQVTIDDAPYDPVNYGPSILVDSQIRAAYSTNNSPWSGSVWLQNGDNENISSVVSVVPGPQGGALLVINQQLPQSVVKVRVTKYDNEILLFHTSLNPIVTNYDIPVGAFTNGVFQLPTNLIAPLTDAYGFAVYTWWAETVDSSGNVNILGYLAPVGYGTDSYFVSEAGGTNWLVAPYFDGRAQLKQNLRFLLRTPYAQSPFYYIEDNSNETETLGSFASTTNYAYTSFNDFTPMLYGESAGLNVYSPFEENYRYRDFIFNLTNADTSGNLTTGITAYSPYYGPLVLLDPSTFQTPIPATNGTGVAAVLATNATRWVATSSYPSEFGVSQSFDGDGNLFYSMTNGIPNFFGLPYISANIAWGNTSGATQILQAGQTVENVDGVFYPEVAQPQFLTQEYDFWNAAVDPLPGMSTFSTGNTSRPLFVAVGSQARIAGYAKLAVTNSIYPGVYGYLGQYFSGAYQIDTSGNVTTNATGILSSYGDLLATQPGMAALVTMPDPETGAQGTCMVDCISLQLDKNHDGTMDTSFNGADATSSGSPFVFWINNNYDRWFLDEDDSTNYEDSLTSEDVLTLPVSQRVPDCQYTDPEGNRVIPTTRDLEDYARLWLSGVNSNLIAALPLGSSVTLSWGDVGSPSYSNPTIDLFAAADADGGIGYLTNATVAAEQTNITQCPYVGRLAPGGSIQLNSLLNQIPTTHYIWCGVSNGTGALTLTIKDASGNVLGQTMAYIQINDIKLMYERWTVGENPAIQPSTAAVTAVNGLPTDPPATAFEYAKPQDTNTPYILYVHGWNMTTEDKDNFAETAFKRLYWQGYQGRFGSFRWPTGYNFLGTLSQIISSPTEKDNFDSSEFTAWLSGQGLLNKLTGLNAEYPGHVYVLAHSMGNVVTGEALRLSGTNRVVNTYVASQAAVSAHTYDANTADVPNYSFYYPPWSYIALTPNIYGSWFAGNNGSAAGRIVSFYNTNDFALSRSHWQLNQLLKPDQNVVEHMLIWNYGYNGSTNDPAPWNNFFKRDTDISLTVNFDIVNVLTNRYETMAYAAQSYATPLGATLNVHNISDSIDLTRQPTSPIWPSDPTGNHYAEHFWHSAQFRGNNAMMEGYWSELLGTEAFGLK